MIYVYIYVNRNTRDQAKNQGKQDLKHNQMNGLILDNFTRYHRAWKTS